MITEHAFQSLRHCPPCHRTLDAQAHARWPSALLRCRQLQRRRRVSPSSSAAVRAATGRGANPVAPTCYMEPINRLVRYLPMVGRAFGKRPLFGSRIRYYRIQRFSRGSPCHGRRRERSSNSSAIGLRDRPATRSPESTTTAAVGGCGHRRGSAAAFRCGAGGGRRGRTPPRFGAREIRSVPDPAWAISMICGSTTSYFWALAQRNGDLAAADSTLPGHCPTATM